jgi:glycosyltransferase involved in cell wall biosynthesis
MVEANASGKPVIAFRGGGAEEIIREGKTGVFFDKQTPLSLASVLKRFRSKRYNSRECKKNAGRFLYKEFERRIKEVVDNVS